MSDPEEKASSDFEETKNDIEKEELKEETQPDPKQQSTIIPFRFDKEECDVIIKTYKYSFGSDNANVSIHFPSFHLKRVSREFESITKNDNNNYEIDATGLSADILIKALSFYFPKYFKYFEDADDLYGLLKVCAKFGLCDLKRALEVYLMSKTNFFTRKDEKNLTYLHMADKFGLYELYAQLMNRAVGFSYTENIGMSLLQMSDKVKYEIIKECIMKKVDENMGKDKDCLSLETVKILHFLDLWFYEKTIFDYSLPSKDQVNKVSPYQRHYKNSYKDESLSRNCRIRHKYDDVIVKVEGVELYMNSEVLSANSPVFKAMLRPNTFKEGQEKIIELPGKNVEDIIDLFTALCQGRKLAEYDPFKIFPLCQEYQINWLQDLVIEKIEDWKLDSDYMKLKFLNLLQNTNLSKVKNKLINSLSDSFIRLQLYSEFNTLETETKLLIALRQLWRNLMYLSHCPENTKYTEVCNEHYEYLGDIKYFKADITVLISKHFGLLSIFKQIDDISFCFDEENCNLCTPSFKEEDEDSWNDLVEHYAKNQ